MTARIVLAYCRASRRADARARRTVEAMLPLSRDWVLRERERIVSRWWELLPVNVRAAVRNGGAE